MRRSVLTQSHCSAVLLSIALAGVAHGQSIDYGAMEQLFGEPVTTSVTGKPQRATDAPANIEIITQDDIRRSGATNIPDVLQWVAGLNVRETGVAGAEVGVRGYNQTANPHLMVLIDGRQVYMVDYGRILWASLPVQLDEIRQIEVIKGPNSALYGFNAVGGVINIITYNPLKDKVNVGTLRGGTQSYLSGSAVGTGQIGGTAGLRLSAGGFTARDFAPGSLAHFDASTRRPPRNASINADGRWQITPEVEAFVSGGYGDTRVSQPSPEGQFYTEQMEASFEMAGINAETDAGLISLSAYRSDSYLGGFTNTQFLPQPFSLREQQTVTVAQASDLVKLGTEHTLRVALEFRDNNDRSQALHGQLTDQILAASVMWDWQITPSVTVTNAVRLDYARLLYSGTPSPISGLTVATFNAVRITQPSANSGIVWKASELDTVRFTVARGVQLPTLLAQGLQLDPFEVGPVAFYGKPSLLPSITWNGEIDYDRTLTAVESVLRTAIFALRTNDIIAPPFGGTISFLPHSIPESTAANVGYSTAAGVELAIKGHNAAGWRWNASYSLAATTNHTTLNEGPVLTSTVNYGRGAPEHAVVLGIGYTLDQWEADLMARWQSSFVDYRSAPGFASPQPVNVNNFITMNARIGYRVADNVTLAVTAQQFDANRIVTTAAAPTERRLIGSVTARF